MATSDIRKQKEPITTIDAVTHLQSLLANYSDAPDCSI